MNGAAPLVSILVPSFNQGRYLPATLDSILSQDHRPLEVIVADGASSDDSVEVLKRYAARHPQLQWLSEKDSGPADAVNKALARARGDICGIQSSDDLYFPGAVRAAVAAFARTPGANVVYGDLHAIDGEGKFIVHGRLPEFSWSAYAGLGLAIPQSSIFFRTAAAREVGGWNPRYYACDLDFWLRLILRAPDAAAPAVHVPQVLSAWRMHDAQRTRADTFARACDGFARMIADCPELPAAPARVRRLVHAALPIFTLLYPPTTDRRDLRRQALAALRGHPTFWRWWNPQQRRRLLRLVPVLRRLAT